jgi:hypothetical protein
VTSVQTKDMLIVIAGALSSNGVICTMHFVSPNTNSIRLSETRSHTTFSCEVSCKVDLYRHVSNLSDLVIYLLPLPSPFFLNGVDVIFHRVLICFSSLKSKAAAGDMNANLTTFMTNSILAGLI